MTEPDDRASTPAARPPSRQVGALLAWLGIVFVAAAIGGIGSASAPDFYAALDRPAWAPPAGVFGPVWSVLYTLMAVSIWLVWRERSRIGNAAHLPAGLFLTQLAANALWSWVFFVWHDGALALTNILALDALVIATVLAFRRARPLAAALLLPYLAWIAFATALTFSAWQRNPGLL